MRAIELINRLEYLIDAFGDQEVWIHTGDGYVYPIDPNILPDVSSTTFYIDIIKE